jgi:hypothetical protein
MSSPPREPKREGPPKACIYVHDKNGKKTNNKFFEALFNPNQYVIDKSNTFASMQVPGLESSIIQFVRGESESLSLELFFDTYTYHSSKNVTEYTNKVRDLLNINEEIHAPPICTFEWGKENFTGIVEKATTTYTMFLEDGTPVRARINLTLKQYQMGAKEAPKLKSSDRTRRRTVTDGDSLWLIAAQEYGSPSMWRAIADANDIDDPLVLKPGIDLIIPKIE